MLKQLLFGIVLLVFAITGCKAYVYAPPLQESEMIPASGGKGAAAVQAASAHLVSENIVPTENVLAVPATASAPTRLAATQTPAKKPSATIPVNDNRAVEQTPAAAPRLPFERWKEWPVLPQMTTRARAIYRAGMDKGVNPRAYSILGDCQSQPYEFMGVYDSDPSVVAQLPMPLKETVRQFSGSFDRYSPTVRDGTTEGALLWAEWSENKDKKCTHGETPIDCELRVHRPAIVFVHVGTHWEARSHRYLTIILDKVINSGAVPVMVTKADNRELDEHVNRTIAQLAEEYDLPLWNFWASVQDLPNHGMESGSDMYLNKEGLAVHRLGGLQALDAVWRQLR